jgi:OmpA-OmpF porin, OOP family
MTALSARRADGSECANPPFSPCFDANSLWLPAGRATFFSMPDTRVIAPGQVGFGAATELLHQPVVLHAASPDADGREIEVLESVVDLSYFLSFGLLRNLEASMLASTRVYQSGAGAGSVASQSAPALSHNAVRDPRLGVAYSLDEALALPGLGLRLAVDATLPLGERDPFANERSFVVMPNATFGYHHGALRLSAEFGARVRQAVDFGGITLGNQGFVAFGVSGAVLPRWLTLSGELFGLPPLSGSRGSAASPRVTSVNLFPAEWLMGMHSAFGQSGAWTLSIAAGGGIPLSSETRDSSSGPDSSYFMGLTTPDFRALIVLRFAPSDASLATR